MTERTTATAAPKLWIRPVTVVDVHDGDTITVAALMSAIWPDMKVVDFGCRIAHVNAAELRTQEGMEARTLLSTWLVANPPTEMQVFGREKYGRLLTDFNTQAGRLSDYVLSLAGSVPMIAAKQLEHGASASEARRG